MNSSFAEPIKEAQKNYMGMEPSEGKGYIIATVFAFLFQIALIIIEAKSAFMELDASTNPIVVDIIRYAVEAFILLVGLVALVFLFLFFRKHYCCQPCKKYLTGTFILVIVEMISGIISDVAYILYLYITLGSSRVFTASFSTFLSMLITIAPIVCLRIAVNHTDRDSQKTFAMVAMALMAFETICAGVKTAYSFRIISHQIAHVLESPYISLSYLGSLFSIIGSIIFPVTIFIFLSRHNPDEHELENAGTADNTY